MGSPPAGFPYLPVLMQEPMPFSRFEGCAIGNL